MVVVIGSVVAREGRLPELLALSQAHVERSRTEPGCLSHAVLRDTEDPQRLVFVEQWLDRAALLQHFELAASRQFVQAAAELSSSAPTLSVYEAEPVTIRTRIQEISRC